MTLQLTTGKIATLMGVAPKTVANWIDQDWLHGFCLPGSRFRRVSVEEFRRFLEEHIRHAPEVARLMKLVAALLLVFLAGCAAPGPGPGPGPGRVLPSAPIGPACPPGGT